MKKKDLRPFLAIAGVVVLMAFTLWSMGRAPWCDCGSASPWSWDVWSSHNSQHLIDPYSFTHVLHGFAFYALLRAVVGKGHLAWRLAGALTIESVWELVENSEAVIQKYRESTISLDYYGDSVANSVADIAACAAGFGIAATLPVWGTIALFVGAEVGLALWIKDGLLLNLLMLISPIEAVKQWQTGGAPPTD